MILFSLLIEKLNSWHSWHLPCGKPLRVYGGSLYPAGSRYASTSPFYATPFRDCSYSLFTKKM
ncbi:hypothetical protein [Fischerella thermalis]|uniref:hypothetical protein n=1 Tax=Fischerella thermalis TaxID=372787 RepID=UPI0008FEFF22|nr:hypothetical protein [Fischerella thermalis]